MLFYFKGATKGKPPVPPEQFYELAVKQVEALIDYKKRGKILAGGIKAGGKGSYAIWDVDSIEELHELISQMPMFPFSKIKIVPLIAYEHALESTKQMVASKK